MLPPLRPHSDETAGSILFRLAQTRYGSVADLAMELFGLSYQQAHADLDLLLPSKRLQTLIHEFGLRPPSAHKLRLPEEWVTTVWLPAVKRYSGPTRLCCACLRENRYGRKFWRTCFAAACPNHGCELIEKCPFCRAPIPYFGAPGGFSPQHWLEAWPTCPACFRLMDASTPAHPVLLAMSRRWLRALSGKPQLGFSAQGFLRVSARVIRKFQQNAPYQETAGIVAPASYWSAHVAASLLLRSIAKRKATPSVGYAALGMPFNSSQLANDIVS